MPEHPQGGRRIDQMHDANAEKREWSTEKVGLLRDQRESIDECGYDRNARGSDENDKNYLKIKLLISSK